MPNEFYCAKRNAALLDQTTHRIIIGSLFFRIFFPPHYNRELVVTTQRGEEGLGTRLGGMH